MLGGGADRELGGGRIEPLVDQDLAQRLAGAQPQRQRERNVERNAVTDEGGDARDRRAGSAAALAAE